METDNKYTHDLQITAAKIPPDPTYVAAVHLSIMAVTIVASIFMILFTVFGTANAAPVYGTSQTMQTQTMGSGYAPVGNTGPAFDFPATSAIDNLINNQKNPDYRAAQMRQAARAVEMFALAAPKTVAPRAASISQMPEQPFAALYLLAAILSAMMLLMVWITMRMWRNIASKVYRR